MLRRRGFISRTVMARMSSVLRSGEIGPSGSLISARAGHRGRTSVDFEVNKAHKYSDDIARL